MWEYEAETPKEQDGSTEKTFWEIAWGPIPEVYDWITNPKYGLGDMVCYFIILYCVLSGFHLLNECGLGWFSVALGAGLYCEIAFGIWFRDNVLRPWLKRRREERDAA